MASNSIKYDSVAERASTNIISMAWHRNRRKSSGGGHQRIEMA